MRASPGPALLSATAAGTLVRTPHSPIPCCSRFLSLGSPLRPGSARANPAVGEDARCGLPTDHRGEPEAQTRARRRRASCLISAAWGLGLRRAHEPRGRVGPMGLFLPCAHWVPSPTRPPPGSEVPCAEPGVRAPQLVCSLRFLVTTQSKSYLPDSELRGPDAGQVCLGSPPSWGQPSRGSVPGE